LLLATVREPRRAECSNRVADFSRIEELAGVAGTAGGVVQIEPQYRTKIKSYVTEHKIRPVTTKEKIVVGGRVPADVELESVPADWGPSLTEYRYVYSGDRVILVDPGSRTVIQEVD
jgi:hypothetical protein